MKKNVFILVLSLIIAPLVLISFKSFTENDNLIEKKNLKNSLKYVLQNDIDLIEEIEVISLNDSYFYKVNGVKNEVNVQYFLNITREDAINLSFSMYEQIKKINLSTSTITCWASLPDLSDCDMGLAKIYYCGVKNCQECSCYWP